MMTWFFWLSVTVIITATVAVAGIQAKKTRPIEHTSMMGMARMALLAFIVIFAYLVFRARVGG
jgi:hypothetical protein